MFEEMPEHMKENVCSIIDERVSNKFNEEMVAFKKEIRGNLGNGSNNYYQ